MPRVYKPGLAMKPCKTNLGHYVRSLRLDFGFTQSAADKLASLPKGYCAKIEGGEKQYLSLEQQQKLAQVLSCDIDRLKELSTKPKPRIVSTEFGSLICGRRIELGQTQRDLAIKTGVTQNTVWSWENGRCAGCSLDVAPRLAIALDLEFSALEKFVHCPGGKIGRGIKPTASQLGQVVRTRRLELNLSLSQLGWKVGMTRQAISMIELGCTRLCNNNPVIDRLAQALNMSRDELDACRPKRKMRRPRSTGLAEFLTGRRQDLKLTQREFGRLVDISCSVICKLEVGMVSPSREMIKRLELALNCEIPAGLLPASSEI